MPLLTTSLHRAFVIWWAPTSIRLALSHHCPLGLTVDRFPRYRLISSISAFCWLVCAHVVYYFLQSIYKQWFWLNKWLTNCITHSHQQQSNYRRTFQPLALITVRPIMAEKSSSNIKPSTMWSSKPVKMKLFGAWEIDKTPPDCIPRYAFLGNHLQS